MFNELVEWFIDGEGAKLFKDWLLLTCVVIFVWVRTGWFCLIFKLLVLFIFDKILLSNILFASGVIKLESILKLFVSILEFILLVLSILFPIKSLNAWYLSVLPFEAKLFELLILFKWLWLSSILS